MQDRREWVDRRMEPYPANLRCLIMLFFEGPSYGSPKVSGSLPRTCLRSRGRLTAVGQRVRKGRTSLMRRSDYTKKRRWGIVKGVASRMVKCILRKPSSQIALCAGGEGTSTGHFVCSSLRSLRASQVLKTMGGGGQHLEQMAHSPFSTTGGSMFLGCTFLG